MKKNVINKTSVEGYLYECKLEKKVSGPNSKNPGTEYISGSVDVAIDDEGTNVITTYFTYITPTYSKSGKTNATFGVAEKLIAEGKTFVQCGTDATKVKIDGSIGVNDFYTEDENGELTLASPIRNEGSFMNIVSAINPDEDKRHTFDCDIVITNTVRLEEVEERGLPERVRVKGVIFDFRKSMLPVEFVFYGDEDGMSYFEGLEASTQNPTFTEITGFINNITKLQKTEAKGAFGNSVKVNEVKKTFKEWRIDWAAPAPYDFGDENVLTIDELKTAQQNREKMLAEVKKRREDWIAQKAAAPTPASKTSAIPSGSFTDF